MDKVKVALDTITSEMERVVPAVAEACTRYWKHTGKPHPAGHDADWTLSLSISALQSFQYMLKHGAMPGILDIFQRELLKYADDLSNMSAGIAKSIADVRDQQLKTDMQSAGKRAADLAEQMRRLANQVAPEVAHRS